jgi:ApaG protein
MARLYYAITEGIRVTVRPHFSPEHSDPTEPRFVFVYRIRIENVGLRTAQLLRRRWTITDDAEGVSEIEGEGVIGEQPVVAPGDVHEYESYCVLRGPSGAMEGEYTFVSSGQPFRVRIPRFELVSEGV